MSCLLHLQESKSGMNVRENLLTTNPFKIKMCRCIVLIELSHLGGVPGSGVLISHSAGSVEVHGSGVLISKCREC